MRVFLACVALIVLPTVAVITYKQYRSVELSEAKTPATMAVTRGEVLFFNATWCGPCRQMKPIVAQLRRQGYHIRDVDVDRNRTLAQKYGIRAVPTFVFVENGDEVKRFSGGTSPENLRKLCSSPVYR
jgi:thioredoxin 1